MQTIEKAKSTLIEISNLDSTLRFDIRYSSKNNFLKRPLYKLSKVYLQEEVVNDFLKINKQLNQRGYGFLIYDGYRPWSITKIFWDETPVEKRIFVADPEKGSNHNRGCALDLTLYDLKTGKEIEMPCTFDTFSEEAFIEYKKCSEEARINRDFLISEMEKDGNFKVNKYEWWHFDHKNCKDYPILDLKFEEL